MVTSLAGLTRRAHRRTSQAPARAQFPSSLLPKRPPDGAGEWTEDFSGPNTEAPGYPSTVERSRCGSVSTWSDWQGLSPLSSLSYSPVRFIAHTPGLKRPSPTLTGRTLPTPDELNKPLRDSHPLRCKKRGVAWTPRAGLGLLLAAITRFDPHDLEGMTPRGVSPSPLSLAGNPESWLSGSSLRWDRTQRLTAGRIELGSSSRTRGLRLRASLAPDKPLSRHPALRVAAQKRVVSPEPFSQFGDRPSRACCSQNPQRSACVSTPATVEARPPRPNPDATVPRTPRVEEAAQRHLD